tara:strand:+ start:1547 stop:2938 length:1392 start_codon:yes stop_codon:yes gene_type:complete
MMSELDFISKLGSSASKIKVDDDIYYKSHKLKDQNEYNAIKKGINILEKELADSIHIPIFIDEDINKKAKNSYYFNYKQTKLFPWINPEWITGEQLYRLGITVLNQQEILVANQLCLIDARPSNYWLGVNNGKLVDLAGIKAISQQNLLSFESDFRSNFINPLILEKDLNIPVSQYFKGKLESCNLNLWGAFGTFKSFTRLKEASINSAINFISNKISSSSPEFVEYLNISHSHNSVNSFDISKSKRGISNQLNILKNLRPNKINKSNWDSYESFHENDYTKNKLKSIKVFVEKHKKEFKIVDLGSNLTTKEINGIDVRIDNDMSVCRQMRQFFDQNNIILQLNIAECLCYPNTMEHEILNLYGEAKVAIMTSIIHHLIIDYGLSLDVFYKNLSKLYSKVLLEFPEKSDPMVKLLISKKNENINWEWDAEHKSKCLENFNIENQIQLSETRFMLELINKNMNS